MKIKASELKSGMDFRYENGMQRHAYEVNVVPATEFRIGHVVVTVDPDTVFVSQSFASFALNDEVEVLS